MARSAPRSTPLAATAAPVPPAFAGAGGDPGAAWPRPDRPRAQVSPAVPRRRPAPVVARRTRPSRTVAALALLLAASGVPARSAAQRASLQQEAVYSAVLRNAAGARVEFECRANRAAGPEVAVGLVLPQGSRLRQDKGIPVKLVTNDLALDAAFTHLGALSGQAVYRWVGIGSTALAVVRRFSKALGTEGELEVQDAETGAAESFAYTVEQSMAVVDALRRCNPIAVQAQRDAAELSLPALIALERNFAGKCRNGLGDERFREDACEERQEYVDRLGALGMCYGRRNEAPQQMVWHRCGPGSYR